MIGSNSQELVILVKVKVMSVYIAGSRWISETEPELGLGTMIEHKDKRLVVNFSAAQVQRTYGDKSAPIKRVSFNIGDEIKLQDGTSFTARAIEQREGLTFYQDKEDWVCETQLADQLNFSKPEQRLFTGNTDSFDLFKLRYQVHLSQRKLSQSVAKGFLGPRISFIPHQYYIAETVTSRLEPRVMLADEVGLGKTIEAGLIIHKLLQVERISRVIVIVPDSLVYQWFVEMLRKFQLAFQTITQENAHEHKENIFEEDQLFIISQDYLLKDTNLAQQLLKSHWDLLVVDEAHKIRWTPEKEGPEYTLINALAEKTPGVILLSATPEILGLSGHFARLKILDPSRFSSYEEFLSELPGYQLASDLVTKLESANFDLSSDELKILGLSSPPSPSADVSALIQKLIDQHGTGRVYFRNTRKRVAEHAEFFPKRILHPYALKNKGANEKLLFIEKVVWLAGFLENHPDEKALLLCHDKETVLQIEKKLQDYTNVKVASFHSAMPLIARDRQAAFFADPEGAQLLVSTEIGSEGRNFEFAQHLILLDLPKLPDLLEQRIGRLDRIGQKNHINIHVPYVPKSSDEVLFRFFNEGLKAFETSPKGATEIYAQYREEISSLMENYSSEILDTLVSRVSESYQKVLTRLETGKDKLVEINSFHPKQAQELIKLVREFCEGSELKALMFGVFELLGVDFENIKDDIYFVVPSSNMSIPHFPGLPNEGMSITFDRDTALKREDLAFITYDHPMVKGIIDLIQSKEIGNSSVSVARLRDPLLIEAFYLLEVIAPKKLQAQRYFPPTPVRILIDPSGKDQTGKYPKNKLDGVSMSAPKDIIEKVSALPKENILDLLRTAKKIASLRANKYKVQFHDETKSLFDREIQRLKDLRQVNQSVSEHEIALLEQEKDLLLGYCEKAELKLDAVRVIVGQQ